MMRLSNPNPDRKTISEVEGGLSIVKISEDAVVKCGFGVTPLEGSGPTAGLSDTRSCSSTDFTDLSLLYLWTCWVPCHGIHRWPTAVLIEDPDVFSEAVAGILKHFGQVRRDKPGPFHEGLPNGQLWLDYDFIAPATMSDMEEYYYERQPKHLPKLDLVKYSLVFCHLNVGLKTI